MQTAIEEINGKLCTVILNDDKLFQNSENWVWIEIKNGFICECATALFALPCYPKPEDAGLLHRYASEGICAITSIELGYPKPVRVRFLGIYNRMLSFTDNTGIFYPDKPEITHAVDSQGNKLEVAICEF